MRGGSSAGSLPVRGNVMVSDPFSTVAWRRPPNRISVCFPSFCRSRTNPKLESVDGLGRERRRPVERARRGANACRTMRLRIPDIPVPSQPTYRRRPRKKQQDHGQSRHSIPESPSYKRFNARKELHSNWNATKKCVRAKTSTCYRTDVVQK